MNQSKGTGRQIQWLALGLILAAGQFLISPALAALPVITAFSPGSGKPGDGITITGSGFTGANLVTFNTTAADFIVVSAAQIRATVPIGATTGPLTVTTPGGTGISRNNFIAAPRIDEFTPANGPPGTAVIIAGANFENTSLVQFNGQSAAFSITGINQIQTAVPVGAATGPIRVTTSAGTGVSTNHFLVTGNEPIITEFSPGNGPAGTRVVIQGQRFSGTTTVKFNTHASTDFTVTAPTQITAVVPAGATTGPISIVTPGGTGTSTNAFTVTPGPIITEFTPVIGPPGTRVIINGANFTGATAVKFTGTNAAGFTVTSASQIAATVPANAASGPISVTTPAGAGFSTQPFTVIGRAPVITEFSPGFGAVGSEIVIKGENFIDVIRVQFGGQDACCFAVTAATEIHALVPAGATNGFLSVTHLGGTGRSTNQFVVIGPQPYVSVFSPNGGPPGTRVIIDGANFAGVTNVAFNGTKATFFAVTAPTQLEVTVPVGATSGLITIANAAGLGSSTNHFMVAPRITGFAPASGPVGTLVSVTGVNFIGTSVVLFNGREAGFTVISANGLNATVPAGATTGPISIAHLGGATSTDGGFLVTFAADLSLSMSASREPVLVGSNFTFSITVTNRGPNAASGVAVTNMLPLTSEFVSVSSSQGACSHAGRQVICHLGNLTNRARANLSITIKPSAVAILTNRAEVSASEADPNPANNSASVQSTSVAALVPSLRMIRTNADMVVTWPELPRGFGLESSSGLDSTNLWMAETSLPAPIGHQYSLVVTNPVGARFYRLRR